MQFDELCALVGALRSRVADLEAKEAVRAERETPTEPVEIRLDLTGMTGSAEIAAIVEAAVKRGLAQVPEIKSDHAIRWTKLPAPTDEERAAILDLMRRMGTRWATGGQAAPGNYIIGERGPETIVPACKPTVADRNRLS